MAYQQKRILVTVVSGLVLFLVYCFSILPGINSGENSTNLQYWAQTMLTFIGVSIVINIVIQIVFHILLSVSLAVGEKVKDQNADDKVIEQKIGQKIKREMVEDERDKMIELKALRFGYYFIGAGMIISLFALAAGNSAVIMLNVLFLSFMVGSILEGFVQYFYYGKD